MNTVGKSVPYRTVLTRLAAGKRARVVAIDGGGFASRRLEAMGIRPGRVLSKVSSVFQSGPVVVDLGSSQVALGYGLASKILVEEVEHDQDSADGQP